MIKTSEYSHLSYAEWYQTIEKPRLASIPNEVRESNTASHSIGMVNETYSCIYCECKAWNSWEVPCSATL